MTLQSRTKKLTAAVLLAKLLTVDGITSGLDADLVRGTTPTAAGLSALSLTSIAAGGLILGNGANTVTTLAIGTTGHVLRSNGTTAAWAALDAGDITAGTLAVARGGTGLASYTTGDTIYASGTTTLSKLGIGAANTVYTSTGSAPQWSTSLALASTIGGTVITASTRLVAVSAPTGVYGIETSTGTRSDFTSTDTNGRYALDFRRIGNTSASGAHNTRSVSGSLYGTIATGQTNSGLWTGLWSEALRNYVATGDTGTLTSLEGARITVGHFNTDGSTPTTTTIKGLYMPLYRSTGTIGTMYGIHIDNGTTSITPTTAYGIKIENTTGTTAYAIHTGSGLISIGDTTDATSTTVAGVIMASGLAVAKGQYIGTFLRIRGTTAASSSTVGTVNIGDGSTATTNVAIGSGRIYAGGNNHLFGDSAHSSLTFQTVFADGSVQFMASGTTNYWDTNIRPGSGKSAFLSFTENGIADRWSIGTVGGDASLHFSTGRVATSGTLADKLVLSSTAATLGDAVNVATGTTTGTKIGTSTSQKLSLWNATPIVQPSSTGETTGWTTGGGSAATSTDTYTGNTGTKAYTVNDIVKHLKTVGMLAAS